MPVRSPSKLVEAALKMLVDGIDSRHADIQKLRQGKTGVNFLVQHLLFIARYARTRAVGRSADVPN